MRSRARALRVGPLIVDWRLTTRDLDADENARGRADDDGMPVPERSTPVVSSDPAGMLLDELDQLSTRGGERDAVSLGRFQHNVADLRALPGVTGPFRAKMASAGGWAALLFSSWRHLKYDRPDISGANRVRAFIKGDLVDARRMRRVNVEPALESVAQDFVSGGPSVAARASDDRSHSTSDITSGATALPHATGTVRWFDSAKGHGFVTCDAGGPDCFLHQSSICAADLRLIEEWTRVAFDVLEGLGGPLAVNVHRLYAAQGA